MKRILTPAMMLLIFMSCTSYNQSSSDTENSQDRSTTMTETDNPFFEASPLPFEAPDFTVIEEKHYLPAFERGMEVQLREIEQIASNPDEPTFENTIVAIEKSGEILSRVQSVFFNMTSSTTNDKIQEIQSEVSPKLAAHSDDILLNDQLFERVKILYDQKDELDLDSESKRVLEKHFERFERAGALLSEEDQARVREINSRLSSLSTDFQENLLEITRERAVIVENRDELEGLSSSRIRAAQEAAEERGYEEKYLLSITNTTRQPVLSSLDNREMRQRVWEASSNRGLGENGGIDNRPLVLEMAKLRAERSEILGFSNYAEYALQPQMAQTPDAALEILTDLIPAVKENSDEEAQALTEMMNRDGIEGELQPWDWEYYAEKVRAEKYDIDDDEVRPYFELNRVLEDGVFYTMERLFGITFEQREDIPVYHDDVIVWNVFDEDGSQIGLFYGDFFARDSKRGGAWMSSFVSQSHLLDQKPVILNVLNIEKPASGEPALISFSNVTTLFHEIGHAVHGLFSDVRYPSIAGTSVSRDFVEFPSTFQEDWAINPEVLANYAIHYETGEQIPAELLDKVIAAQQFNQGFDTQEYIAAALLDMEWHTLSSDQIPDDAVEFEEQALEKYGLDNPAIPPRYKTAFFAHIWQGGYAANYYAYLWSEVLAADAFAYMKESDGLTRQNGENFRRAILSRGGSDVEMELYKDFRGQEPGVEALLKRRGLN